MDDIFKILIWGIIIFSFLRPLFKKKQTENKTRAAKPKDDNAQFGDSSVKEDESVPPPAKNDEYDILKEIENMFKGNVGAPQQQQTKPKRKDNYDVYESSEIQDKDLSLTQDPRMQRNVEDEKPISYRSTYDKKNLSGHSRQKRVIDAKIEAEAKNFEKVLESLNKSKRTNLEFIRKIRNPSSIKEYVIFSEILGKPKAMRR